MTFDYAATAARALGMLQRFGEAATIKRTSAAAYDPTTGTSAETVTSLTTTACVFDYEQKYIDGSLILMGDKQAYMASTHEPKQGDKVTWVGVDYTVVSVKAVPPNSTPVIYEAQIRG